MKTQITVLKRILILLLLGLLIPAAASCARKAGEGAAEVSGADAAEQVLRAVIEYPGEGLYSDAQDKTAWQDTLGGCFADGKFEEFYESFDRTSVLTEARTLKLTTRVTGCQESDGQFTVTIEATDETGHADTYVTIWQVDYDSADPDLLDSVELLADGGFFCRTGCPL